MRSINIFCLKEIEYDEYNLVFLAAIYIQTIKHENFV